MIRNTFLAFYRTTTRHPLYAGLNLLGLGFGIAVFITLGLYVRFETSFESWIEGADSLYVVYTDWVYPGASPEPDRQTMGALLDDLREDFPQLLGTRRWVQQMTVHQGAQVTHEVEVLVDPTFFQLFPIDLVEGDKSSALSSPDKIMLTQAMAEKYFGKEPALGKTVRLTVEEGDRDYIVSGVMKTPPLTSDLTLDFVRLITPQKIKLAPNWHHYGSSQLSTYLSFKTPAEAAQLNAQLDRFIDSRAKFPPKQGHEVMRQHIAPLRSVHLDDEKTRTSVLALGLVGLLAFGIAAVNYINLATARAGLRAREVAVRKSLGANQAALRRQFLGEALLTTVIATVIGLSIVELALPLINSYGGLSLGLHYGADWQSLLVILGVILAVGLLAGLYPALVLAGFKPAMVLASSRTPSGGRLAGRVREALVVLQFTVVIVFFILVAGFVSQIEHMKSADLGFKREGLLLTSSTGDTAVTNAQRDSFWNALRAQPGVLSMTASDSAPGDDDLTNRNNMSKEGYVGEEPNITTTVTGPDYFNTYGARLLAGRYLDATHGADRRPDDRAAEDKKLPRNVVINASAVRALDLGSPDQALGQIINDEGRTNDSKAIVVGVIEDARFRTPKREVPPMMYYFTVRPTYYPITGIRYSGVSEPAMRARVTEIWRGIAPEVPFDLISAVDNLDKYYKPDLHRSNLFNIGAVIAALIGCIGLYGLASFNTSRRMLEIGLRKVLGAPRGAVVRLLVIQFLRPMLFANVIAWPVAYWTLSRWLSQFDDRIAISALYFLAASALALLIAIATVAGIAFAGASTEPGKALRYE